MSADVIWIAVALVLVLEGIGPMLFPNRWRNLMQHMSAQSSKQLQTLGGTMVTIGLVCLYFLL